MNRKKLLSTLDSLSFPARQRFLVKTASESSADELGPLLDALKHNLYEAQCALTMAAVRKDSEFILSALGWEWPQARKRAAKLLVDLPEVPERLVEATLNLDRSARQAFLRKIRRVGRSDLASLLLKPIEDHFGPNEAALLLPALGAQELERGLEHLSYRLSSWRTLAGRHPDRVLDFWRKELERRPRVWRGKVWYRFSSAVEILVQKRAEKLLLLAKDLGDAPRVWTLFSPYWGTLTSKSSHLVLELLKRDDFKALWTRQGLPTGFLTHFRRFDLQTQLEFCRPLAQNERQLEQILSLLAPSERERLFREATAELDLSQQRWSESFMRVLPHPVRSQEADRMLSLAAVSSTLEGTVSVLGLQSPEKSALQLKQFIRNPKPEIRSSARWALVMGAGLYRQGLDEVVAGLSELRNETDPVRSSALGALNTWPYECFSAEHITGIRTILQEVCQARDTSESTRSVLRSMALRWIELAEVDSSLFRFGLEVLSTLSDSSAAVYLSSLENYSEDRRRALVDALISRIDKEIKGENYHPLFCLCRALGDKLPDHPDLEERLAKLSRSKNVWEAKQAIAYWLGNPDERGQRVESLLKDDLSAIAVPSVAEAVNRQRQDLLDGVLRKKAIKGRFLTGKTIFVPSFWSGFENWLPRQQEAFADLHALIFEDKNQTLGSRASSVRMIGKLCYVDDGRIRPFFSHAELALREAALVVTEDVDVLLGCLDSQEARVAVFRLSTLVRESRPVGALGAVNRALTLPNKLTSKKELYRMFGTLRALPQLDAAWREDGQHRDLRIAVLHALTEMLDLGRAREVFYEAMESENPWVARAALAAPRDQVPPQERAQWVDRLTRLLQHSDATLTSVVWSRLDGWAQDAPGLLATTASLGVCDLKSTAWRQAVELLTSCATAEEKPLTTTAKRLVELDTVKIEGRDRPARQRLRHLLNRVAAQQDTELRSNMLRDIGEVSLPESWLRYTVRVESESWADLAREVETFEEMEALLRAVKGEVARPDWDAARLLKSAQELASETSPTARRIGVELLALAGAKTRWNEACCGLLDRLRQDEYPGVAERAGLLVARAEP